LEGLGRPKHGHTAPLPQRGTVLLLHDYNSQMEFMSLWAFELAQAGYRVVLVDLRGHGASTGQEVSYGKWETEDLKTVLDRLTRDRLCDAKVGVLGVGYGATLALQFAARDARVATVVAIAPYHRFEQACQRLAAQEAVPVPPQRLHGALEAAAAHLGINWDDWSAEAALRGLKTPVLLIGGGKDPIATGDDLKALERLSPAGSRSLVIPEADHWFIAYWLHDLSKPVEAWVGQHLP
jgi:pimeloyl-ACP methyl ester carboxylesterase